jgi:hypothetical protein
MSVTYIVHPGTGTVIASDECVIVNVPDEVLDNVPDDEEHDDVIVDYAKENGRDINTTDLKWGNCVAYSPSAIREEILESLRDYFPDDKEALDWGLSATDDQLNEVASYIIQSDTIWETYRTDIIDGLREGLRWSKEDK